MKLLLDQGLPRSTVFHLNKEKIDAVHVSEKGLAAATDTEILQHAREKGRIVVTLDADFHALLALSGAGTPSVIRVRIEGLRAEGLSSLLTSVLFACQEQLTNGAMVTVTENGIRVRQLPLLR
jgi:predicted nuclease of predicted toxin-antitoxin system